MGLQLNLSATVTLGKEESGHWKEVALVEKLKQEWMYALTAKKKKRRCTEVAVLERWTLVEVRV